MENMFDMMDTCNQSSQQDSTINFDFSYVDLVRDTVLRKRGSFDKYEDLNQIAEKLEEEWEYKS